MGNYISDFLVSSLDIETASQFPGARWEPFQLYMLDFEDPLLAVIKSRQVAFSFTAAAKAVARALIDDVSSIFVSINQEEASEKMVYARAILNALQVTDIPKITTNNKLKIEFANGASLISMPSKAPRGKAKRDIYIDEMAHMLPTISRLIFSGSLPIISKGGRITIGSTPFGSTGFFWEVITQTHEYPDFSRIRVPWWSTFAFCNNVQTAVENAPLMQTVERIQTFGTKRIQLIYKNMLLEDFQTEYECMFADGLASWLTWEEIQEAQEPELMTIVRTFENEVTEDIFQELAARFPDAVFYAGFDVGRVKHSSELLILAAYHDSPLQLVGMYTLQQMRFDPQEELLKKFLRLRNARALIIDQTGIGRPLAEKLHTAFPVKVHPVMFTPQSKAEWASTLKVKLQQHGIKIPTNRDLAYQMHSVKREFRGSIPIYDVESAGSVGRHHADKFWALAMAVQIASNLLEQVDNYAAYATTQNPARERALRLARSKFVAMRSKRELGTLGKWSLDANLPNPFIVNHRYYPNKSKPNGG